jgi:catechol 2,3-dioxygenase-like lactoylglutathione lyase family enzyme
MPAVHGILETAVYCKDLQKAAEFYRRLFDCPVLLDTDRLIALDIAGRSVLLLFKQGATNEPFDTGRGMIPAHSGTGPAHFAFAIDKADLPGWREKLAANDVAIESEVQWPEGAISIYFRDPDNHAAELITQGFWKLSG